jgi:hypothetical protein
MATTTNYGWTTPDDTALVKDGAAAIRTLGSSVDTTTKALNPSTTLGDIEYRSSTANTNTRLGIGSTGNILTVAGGVPTWAAPAGGKLLQVVSTTKTDTFSTNSTSFTDITGLSVTITPTSATSKIMVLVSLQASGESGSNSSGSRLMRDSTAIFIGDAASSRERASVDVIGGSGGNRVGSSQAPMILDAPATTSALTYKVQIKSLTAGNSYVNRGSADTDDSGHQRTASSITVMEIGA